MAPKLAYLECVKGRIKPFKNNCPALTEEKRTKGKQKDAHNHEGYSLSGYSLRSSGMRREGAKARVLYLGGSILLCPGTHLHYTPIQHEKMGNERKISTLLIWINMAKEYSPP